MTGSRAREKGNDSADRDREHQQPPARRHAQEVLLVLGYLGRAITDAMTQRIPPDLADNAEVLVVTHLDVHGASRPGEMIAVTGMTSGGMTKLLNRLEQGGYITREFGSVPGDRRATLLSLTSKGRHLAADYADAILTVDDDVQRAVSRLYKTKD